MEEKNEAIDEFVIMDEDQLPLDALDELSNGKGDDEQ